MHTTRILRSHSQVTTSQSTATASSVTGPQEPSTSQSARSPAPSEAPTKSSKISKSKTPVQSTLDKLRRRPGQSEELVTQLRPAKRQRVENAATISLLQEKVAAEAKEIFEASFLSLCKCDTGKTEHPTTAFLYYELNLEHRFMAAALDSLTKTMSANNIELTPENVDKYLKPTIIECVAAAKNTEFAGDGVEMPNGMKTLFANPEGFQPKSKLTWDVLDKVGERLGLPPKDAWQLIIDRKKIAMLNERGIQNSWLLVHLFDAEANYSPDLANGWRHMLEDVDSSEPFSMEMARRWHATCTGRDGSRPSEFCGDTSCPIVEDVSLSKKGETALRDRLRMLNDDYGISSKIYKDEETAEKTQKMGKKFFYVNRVDTQIERLERFGQKFTERYLSVIKKISGRTQDDKLKSDKLLMEDANYLQHCENAHLFPDGNGRVWAVLFPNYCLLKRGESPTLPYEPYVIDGNLVSEICDEYRLGQEAFEKLKQGKTS